MAMIIKRTWTSQGPTGRRVRHVAYGYTLMRPDGTRERKASSDGARILATRLLSAFGPDLPVRQLTAPAIAQYERPRMAEVRAYTVALELAVLRHMLRLGRRWGYLDEVPEIEMPKKPEGRQRYLDEGEITRLLDACRASWPAPRDHRDDRD